MKIIWKKRIEGNLGLGQVGEAYAVRYLQRRRYLIVARNYRFRDAELDIVARRGEMLVFIEVKTRSSEAFGPPIMGVTSQKVGKIILGAQQFCQRFQLTDFPQRLDVIEVELKRGFLFWDWLRIRHHVNAFEAPSEF